MKKLICGIMLSAASAGALVGYYDVSTDPNMMGFSAKSMAPAQAKKMLVVRSKATIETDMKNTEKAINDLDKRIPQERNTMVKKELQQKRATQANRLKQLEEELSKAK